MREHASLGPVDARMSRWSSKPIHRLMRFGNQQNLLPTT